MSVELSQVNRNKKRSKKKTTEISYMQFNY